jgi:hypothetical protein
MTENISKDIIELQREQRKKEYNSIFKGFCICDEIVDFEAKEIFDGEISIWLPKAFTLMSPALAKIKYPSETRPHLVMTSPDLTVNFTFSLLNSVIAEEELTAFMNTIKTALRSANPSVQFFQQGVDLTTCGPMAWFDYKNFAIDDSLYNLMYIIPLRNKSLLGTFNCPFSVCEEWRSAVRQTLLTITNKKN